VSAVPDLHPDIAALAPLLSRRHGLLVPDLPGHAFTGLPPGGAGAPQLSLPGMARAVHGLLHKLGLLLDHLHRLCGLLHRGLLLRALLPDDGDLVVTQDQVGIPTEHVGVLVHELVAVELV
jgi:hypothetical protein